MPEVKGYLQGFGLQQGLVLAGYELVRITVGHEVVDRYQTYQYPSTLSWQPVRAGVQVNELLRELSGHLDGQRVIYTSYGNPYSCSFGELQTAYSGPEGVVIRATGECNRVRN